MDPDSLLARLKRRRSAQSPAAKAKSKATLEETLACRKWRGADGGTKERVGYLSQIDVAQERYQPFAGKRILILVAALASVYALFSHMTLRAQLQRWEGNPEDVIAYAGPESSFLTPLLVSFWYLFFFFALTRSFDNMLPQGAEVFAGLILYNVLQAAMNFYVIISVVREAYVLQVRLAGNPAPVQGAEHHRLGMVVIFHYHLRMLELLDTFFLILRKKVGRSLTLHVLLRLQNVWGWHVACCYGCGGDIYFPVLTNAIGSLVLHFSYALALLEPHVGQLGLPFKHLLPGPSHRRKVVTSVHVWVLRTCLMHALLSFFAGAYPRFVIAIQIIQILVGLALYTEFHYDASAGQKTTDSWQIAEDAHAAKLVFSFDSCGWCFLYHFGVAIWIQEHFPDQLAQGELAFSGSSGGAIVATGLAAGTDMVEVVESLLTNTWPKTRLAPWALPKEIDWTLNRFVAQDAHVRATNRLRILLTRVQSTPPFLMGEVAQQFGDRETLFDTLSASSHMPLIMGLGFPMNGGRYIDGLLWANAFVPWRAFSNNQRLCRVSAFSALGADIGPRWNAIPPPWWPAFPPSPEALEGMMWAGYRDVAAAFGSGDGRYSGCGGCSKRQRISIAARLTGASSERVDELIQIYECTAQRQWAIIVGSVVAVTVSITLVWLRMLAAG